ncbi:MAG: CapA family protein [Lachnospiraceae bacterium]
MYENDGRKPVNRTTAGAGNGQRPRRTEDGMGTRPAGNGQRPRRPEDGMGTRPAGNGQRPRRPEGGMGTRPAGNGQRPRRPEGGMGTRPAGNGQRPRRPEDGMGTRPAGNGQRPRKPEGGRPPRRPGGEDRRRPVKPMTIEERRKREYMKLKKEREKRNKIVIIVGICLIAALLLFGVVWSIVSSVSNKDKNNGNTNGGSSPTVTVQASDAGEQQVKPTDTPVPTPTPTPKTATLIAVGDDLVHTGVYQAGLQSDGTHDYSCLFANVAPYISDADIKVINQETIFGGDEKGLSSYPSFNSPEAIGDSLVDAGFNVVLHASNHALDMGLDGLLNSVTFWKTEHPEVTMIGIYETAEEQSQIKVIEVNGIKFALLNYTYSHNWETLSQSAEGHLNMLCDYDPDTRYIDFNTINPQVISDIQQAETLADFTIVFPHWGTEYVMGSTTQQTTFAKQMTEAGADLIVGTHPHVIEPVEWVEADNGNRALCYYSLGNFTSTQDELERILGGMAKLTIIQDETGTYIDEESIKAIPLVTHYVYPGWNGATVVDSTYLLRDYTEDMAASHGLLNRKGITVTRDKLLTLAQDTFGEYFALE